MMDFDIITSIGPTQDIDYRLAYAFLQSLTQNKSVNKDLVKSDGSLSNDAKNILNVLMNVVDYDFYDFGKVVLGYNRTPISNPIVPSEGYAQTDIQLGDLSVDPDGNIVSRLWTAGNGDPEDNTFQIVNSGSSNPTLKAKYPGVYSIGLEVTDNQGKKNYNELEIMISENTFDFRAMSFGTYFDPNLSLDSVREHLIYLRDSLNVNIVSFDVIGWYQDVNNLDILLLPEDKSDPRGYTPSDVRLKQWFNLVYELGMQGMLKLHIDNFENSPDFPSEKYQHRPVR